ncbi:hypothetical protein OCGS_0355 [Oceaniovalibus guishaninsula JLT2003]|uniref:Uncharacterized protein n=1 Tax=Oceaniovalibus guishaninsula JLT2003 TaxID=1231392 RepID=K2I899_9RHOB|nr:hypothetical protein OCGS_0355 [Oceaniovalibus guishaninsula JLT2003]
MTARAAGRIAREPYRPASARAGPYCAPAPAWRTRPRMNRCRAFAN